MTQKVRFLTQHSFADNWISPSPTAVFDRFPSHRVVLNRRPVADWSKVLENRFNELTSLRPGWDGYTGRPVSFACARFAADLLQRLYEPDLPPPSLVPGSDGTVQIEWHLNGFDIEVDVLAPYNVSASRYNCATEQFEEVELDSDFTLLSDWIGELKFQTSVAIAVGA